MNLDVRPPVLARKLVTRRIATRALLEEFGISGPRFFAIRLPAPRRAGQAAVDRVMSVLGGACGSRTPATQASVQWK